MISEHTTDYRVIEEINEILMQMTYPTVTEDINDNTMTKETLI